MTTSDSSPTACRPQDLALQATTGDMSGLKRVLVMPGDTLPGILQRQGFRPREIALVAAKTLEINQLEQGRALRIGQSLWVPNRTYLAQAI